MLKIIALIISFIISIESIPLHWAATMKIDADNIIGETSTRATGFLYGLSEEGVPSSAITESLKISSVSQKVTDGLQHPTGDVDHVVSQLDNCDYIVVYLQDAYSTWYYDHKNIEQMRQKGTYDWEKYIKEDYFPKVIEAVNKLESSAYADRLVYCIYNEPDNAVWFGNYVDGRTLYDEVGKDSFNKAWKMTYDLVKSLAPESKIGGPGFCGYDNANMEHFISFAKENDCVPEIMIYHELADWTIPIWQNHVDDYRALEKKYGIEELPIVVTEYGAMEDCGNPARMIQYLVKIENSGVWGNMAFWRLANNLNDTAADYNTPNSNWWLYRKYAELEDNLLKSECTALLDRDLHDGDWLLSYNGLASINDEKDSIKIIASGSENKRQIKIKNINKTNLGCKVNVKIECVYFEGISGKVYKPVVLRQYNTSVASALNITVPATDTEAVYFVTVTPAQENAPIIRNTNIPVRYEFEAGELLGKAYTYRSAYSTSGEEQGMCGGFENDGDGIKLKIYAEKDGLYDLKLIYGKANDSADKNGRDYAKVRFSLDGKEEILSFPNTIKSEYTDSYTLTLNLKKGCHELVLAHCEGTFVLDSALLSLHEESSEIAVLEDSNDGSAFIAIAPFDGYYKAEINKPLKATVDGAECSLTTESAIYLRRGLNEIKFTEGGVSLKLYESEEKAFTQTVTASEIAAEGKAFTETDKYGVTYLDGISSEGGKAQFKVNVPKEGTYRMTVNYANNLEGGYHDYNVDLIEALLTVTTSKGSKDIMCRNTYSLYNYTTVTFNVELTEGENTVTFSNSGNVIFDGRESFAPRIESVTVAAVSN